MKILPMEILPKQKRKLVVISMTISEQALMLMVKEIGEKIIMAEERGETPAMICLNIPECKMFGLPVIITES